MLRPRLDTDTPHRVLTAGTLIGGDFEILEPLGSGGMGEVYLARQQSTDTLRAVKVLIQERLTDPEYRALFEREARSTGRIQSEHVVEMVAYGLDRVRKLPWLAMEYLEGETLSSAVARFGVPPEPWAKELLLQLFHGVAAAHDENITHLDLKPDNIFLARSRRADVPFTIKVLDFGIARFGKQRWNSAPRGTRLWSAPEQRSGATAGPASDVWALGLIVFWLLSGKPYTTASSKASGSSASARARQVGNGIGGAAFDAWFGRCVAPEPSQRFPDAATCWRELVETWPELGPFDGGALWKDVAAHLVARPHQEAPTGTVSAPQVSSVAWPSAGSTGHGCRVFDVPQPSQSFVGRSNELLRLRNELARGHVRVCASVEGLPGIGKTELVLQLAHRLAQQGAFPGGVFWFAAEQGDLTRTWASEAVAGALGVTARGMRERARAAIRAVSASPRPVLVVLDNVESWEEGERPGPLPTGIHVSLLITTRGHRVGGSRFRSLPLGFLPRRDACGLMELIAGPTVVARAGFEELLDELGGYTVAVELAAAYLAEYPEVTPQEYLDSLARQEPEPDLRGLTRYERTARQAFREQWEKLSAPVRRAWLLAAQFAPEPVTAALSDEVGLGVEERRVLRRLHLIESDERGTWRMHRLVRQFVLEIAELGDREAALRSFLGGVHARLLGLQLATGFRVYGPDRAHFDAAVRLAQQRPYDEQLGEMVASVANGLQSLGELEPARELLDWVLDGDLRLLGDDHAKVATLRSNLSLVLQELGEFTRARELLERALASDLRERSDDASKILLRRSNLARLLQDAGDQENGGCARARQILESAIDEALPALGEQHWMIAIARSNLSSILCELGELDAALRAVLHALDSDRARLGDDAPFVGIRRFRLGVVLATQGNDAGAERELREALRIELSNVWSEHPRVAVVRAHLSVVLERSGALDAAETERREALRVARRQRPRSTYRTAVEQLLGEAS